MARQDGNVPFEFYSVATLSTDLAKATVAQIPRELGGKPELLKSLALQLSFPPFFGENWDALEECLVDLLPNQGREIAIVHEGLPDALSQQELRAYLGVLSSAVVRRRSNGEPRLRVLFPLVVREPIQVLLS